MPQRGSSANPHLDLMPSLSNYARCLRLPSLLVLVASSIWTLAAADSTAPIVPREMISLFNGRDLAGFYSWIPAFGRTDPDRVFTVVDQIDGAPALRISGQHFGGLLTHVRYADFRLVAEFRWGLLSWGKRRLRARDSGILLHCEGEDGNAVKAAGTPFNSPWLRSVEYQIIEGGTGDIIIVTGFDRNNPNLIAPRLTASVGPGGSRRWTPNGRPVEFDQGRIAWQHRDRARKDEVGFRGAHDVEKPPGEWNRIEAVCSGGDLVCYLNGVQVNEARNGTFRAGKILFQSEGAEIFFRRIELHPLTDATTAAR